MQDVAQENEGKLSNSWIDFLTWLFMAADCETIELSLRNMEISCFKLESHDRIESRPSLMEESQNPQDLMPVLGKVTLHQPASCRYKITIYDQD